MLALDLGVLNRRARVIPFKEAVFWSIVWTVLALLFNVGLYYRAGELAAKQFLAGYLIERALSVDNIFVFILIFAYFQVPRKYQHRALFWGILGALVFRGAMIAAGAALLAMFHWVIYIFGFFLVVTGAKMAFQKTEEVDVGRSRVLRLARRVLPISHEKISHHFVVREDGKTKFTVLFLVLLVIETSDIVFALDSIPAIFAITNDTFIVFTSNIFAILGLRALYFVIAGVMELFRYLKIGLSVVLVFIGVKMLIEKFYEIPVGWALIIVAVILTISILASLVVARVESRRERERADQSPSGLS